MVFVVPQHQIVYAPVPKAACTSLKMAMHKLAAGSEFQRQPETPRKGIQRTYPCVQFDTKDFANLSNPWLFTVLRDPAQRVLSTWSNKVAAERCVANANKRHRAQRGFVEKLMVRVTGNDGFLNAKPSVDEFVLNLQAYVDRYPVVSHHVESVSYFCGDLSAYDRVYTVKEIPQLEADIRARTGVSDFNIPKHNSSPDEIKVTPDDLSDEAFDALITWLTPEYELLEQWFQKPSRANRNMQQTGTI